MKILVIDGQGGQLGSQLIKAINEKYPQTEIMAVGTNAVATAAMLVACRSADLIIGPIGIVIADSLLGEITPAMAVAVGQSRAAKILLPVSKCENLVAGVANLNVAALIEDALAKLQTLL